MDLSPYLLFLMEKYPPIQNKNSSIGVAVVEHYLSKCDSIICLIILLYASMKLFAYKLAFFSDPLCMPPFVLI